LSWLFAALKSSVGKKCVMGATGLFLCLFLVIHLAGNLLLYRGAESYNHYAHSLHANPAFIAIAEVVLYAMFIVHIYLAITTSRENDDARGDGYAVKKTKRTDRIFNFFGWTPDTTMFATGAVVFFFLLVHLNDFSWEILGTHDPQWEPFEKAAILMSDLVRGLVYLVGSLFLGVHVAHGLQSACQSLGMNHPLFRRPLRYASIIFAFVVAIGFGSFTLWGWSQSGALVRSESAEVAPAAPEGEAPADSRHLHRDPDQK
jgi:succinate dehydrogenase / fumarate reductase cytochrome b subunit